MFPRGVFVVVLSVVVAACGHGSTRPPDVIAAGQLDIKLPPGWTVTAGGARRPTAPVVGDVATADAATGDTVPLAKQDPSTAFFKSTSSFSQCLKDRGTTFRGVPDQSKPDAPANDPAYIKDLSTCAAKSNVLQTMKDFQKAQDDMTPAQIKEQNQGYLRWRTCMIGRGWGIPQPKPDAKGRLFSFGGGGGAPAFTPPNGEDLLTSSDLQDCAAQTQAKAKR